MYILKKSDFVQVLLGGVFKFGLRESSSVEDIISSRLVPKKKNKEKRKCSQKGGLLALKKII